MKPIVLLDFLKRLAANGVNLMGCTIQGVTPTGTYQFMQVQAGNVQVRYGFGFKEVGHMSRGLLVTGVSLVTKQSGKRIVGTRSRNDSIVVHFKEPRGRW